MMIRHFSPQKIPNNESISKVLSGFQKTEDEPGYEILTAKAWDYNQLIATYQSRTDSEKSMFLC